MAIKSLRIGSMENVQTYDDAVFPTAIETTEPISVGAPVNPSDAARLSDLTGLGDVSGPAGATADAIARFSGTGGKTLKNSKITIDDSGVIEFDSGSGLQCADMFGYSVGDLIAIAASGYANRVQVTSFEVDGINFGSVTPDHTTDDITVGVAGHYLCNVSITIESDGANPIRVGLSVFKNNGTTEFTNLHADVDLPGGGGDSKSVSLSGIINLAAADTVELWIWNATNTDDIIVNDLCMSLVKIGRG